MIHKILHGIICAALGLIAICAPARSAAPVDPQPLPLYLPRHIPVKPDVQYGELLDALAVEVRTGDARGADTWSGARLSICDLTLRLKPAGPEFTRGQTARMVFLLDGWTTPGGVSYPALPYGYIKFCDITLQHDSALPEPGWHALRVRLFFHVAAEGRLWHEPHNGWYRYASAVHFFNGDDWWQAEYGPPYDLSAPKSLQYFGAHAGGNKWLALAFKKCPDCDLSAVNLRGADLAGGEFTRANFSFADLTGAALQGATLTGATFRKATLARVALDAQDLSGSDLSGSKIHKSSLSGTNLQGANLTAVDAFDSDFSHASLAGAAMNNAAFVYCNFQGAALDGVHMQSPDKPQQPGARLIGSLFQGASFRNAVLRGAGLDNTDLRGADLSGALVDKLLIMHNIRTDETTVCPDGGPGPCKW